MTQPPTPDAPVSDPRPETPLSPALFWAPRFLGPSPVMRHVPFLFWAMDRLRPGTVLGLGLRSGEGYFALCQAVDTLGLSARAWGFGDWCDAAQHDATASPRPTVPQSLQAHNTRYYADMSRLAHLAAPDAALARFDADMFDLILIDGSCVPRDSVPLAQALTRHATPRGAILVLGTALAEDGSQTPGGALALALAEEGRAVFVDDQDGCALVVPGPQAEAALADMAGPRPAGSGLPALQDVVARLGQGHLDAWHRQRAEAAIAQAEGRAITASDALSDATTEAAALRDRLEQGHALRLRETRLLTAELERLTEENRALGAQVDTARDTRLEGAEQEIASLKVQHFEAVSDLETERDRLARALTGQQAMLDQVQTARDAAETALAQARHALAESHARAEARITEQATAHERAMTQAAERAAAKLAAREQALTAAHEAARATQASTHRAELDRLSSEARMQTAEIAHLKKALAAAQRIQAGQKARLGRMQVQIKLAQWQAAWLAKDGGRVRLGKRPGPSGGSFAQELAAVAQSPLFDAAWYLSAYPDLQDTELTPVEHFLRHGLFEGRDPGPNFRTLDWFLDHPEALEARRNPLVT